ncbi:DEAD/DEAH box helicase [Peribacillus deserti]|uniref:Helicase SNF n=1 Tax=Peribacillus deserti TaxID=673318 RepID=A0A2N5M3F1_9BACI|nr:DEAD/DEAH box helicase [Peribacillus deserti]PLT28887.1 helicase SNF [Peribacillus deserti]
MNIKLDRKKIIELCGTVSFKRGEAFYRADKVVFTKFTSRSCAATVSGAEDFHVEIEIDAGGNIQPSCSCPSLASFTQECQHVAAVLLAAVEQNRKVSTPAHAGEDKDIYTRSPLSKDFFNLFNGQAKRSSGQQIHFESRQEKDAEFICETVVIGEGYQLFGISMKIAQIEIKNIRSFLESINEGKPCILSSSFTFDPQLHCFLQENQEVVQELIRIVQDENFFIERLSIQYGFKNSDNTILITPSSWEKVLALLGKAPSVRFIHEGIAYSRVQLSRQPLPIRFEIAEADKKGLHLTIKGLTRLDLLYSYRAVISEGKIVQLDSEDFNRISELQQILQSSGTNTIPIHQEQLEMFLKKVVPGLKKIGTVSISGDISGVFGKTPLNGKLYLDRVKNRLLASLEFHYEHIMINPAEDSQSPSGTILIRDMEKEEAILHLMEECSFTQTDSGYFLHNEALEYEFLYHVLPKLQKLVQIYATTAVRNRIFRENARPKIKVGFKKERTNWLEFKFEMDGIHEKHIRDILSALEEKRKYYRLRDGALLSLETREFEEVHQFLHALPAGSGRAESTLRIPLVQGMQVLDAIDVSASFTVEPSFQTFLDSIRDPGSLEFEIPENLEPILRDYQKKGYYWMKTIAHYGFGGILADDMGLGKTLQSITFILSVLSEIRESKLPALIICPSSLTYNWLSEFMKFAPDVQAVVMDGNKTERNELQKNLKDIDVVITSYPLIRRDSRWFEKQTFHTVFFDEAQSFKNPATQTAKLVKQVIADHRFALTGTPVENSLEELWSIFHVVFPQLFKGIKDYSNLSRKTIARRIKPFLLRRMKEDVLSELPEKIESIASAELLPEQKKLYAAYLSKLRHDTLKHLDKDTLRKNRIKILAGLTRLRQICCHPALFVDGYQGSSAKFEQLMQILKDSRQSGRRILIFSQFTKMLQLIGREAARRGHTYFYLDGQTSSEMRVDLCDRFNAGEQDLFLISLKAGGTGLNLTGADTVVLYDIWWNPAVDQQAADRAYRIGQTNAVEVIKLVARGTIEEKIDELQEKKKHLVQEIIGSKDKRASTLTEEDIREILLI